jgi:signal transduction histidine kinase
VWRRLVGDRPIVTRLVLAVTGAMAVVLTVTGGFVFWRVEFALDRQLDQDLKAYQDVVERAVASGASLASDTPGQSYQVYGSDGRVVAGDARVRLIDEEARQDAAADGEHHEDVGNLFPPVAHPYRVVATPVRTASGEVVVASAISKSKHDEALRELFVQLVLADLAALAAAAVVGYGTARAALDPVERYRVAAETASAADDLRLPVPEGRDDELSRLGHTFNGLLARIALANERERQFLGDASHELRSPLALMRTELEWALMRPTDDPEEDRTAFQSLQGQVERLIGLSNALLDLEEVHSTTATPQDAVELPGLLAEVVAGFTAQAEAQGRSLTCDVTPGLVVTGNRRWLELAMDNLVSNALRYGEGTVAVVATADADATRISVTDEGAGFPDDFAGKAFDRFTRADPSRASRGTGLGLALVQAVAEAHGGQAAIDGSGVRIELPREPVRAAR